MKTVQMSSLSNPFHYKRTIELKKQDYEYRVCVSHCVTHHIHTLKQEEQAHADSKHCSLCLYGLYRSYICVHLCISTAGAL